MPIQLVFTLAAAAGLLTAGLYLSVMGGPVFLLFQYLTQLPLFLVGLGLGFAPALVSSSVALVVALIADATLGLVFLIGYVGPTLLVVQRALLNRPAKSGALEWYPPGQLLAEASVYVLMIFLVGVIWFSGQDGGLAGVVERSMVQVLSLLGTDAAQRTAEILHEYLFVVPGIMGVSWVTMMVVNAALAQWLLTRSGRNLRPSPTFTEVRLPIWLSYLLGVSILLAFLGEGVLAFAGGSMMMILMTPHFFQGAGVIHQWAYRSASSGLILVAFYLLIVFLQWPILCVVGLGVADQWANFRRHPAA